MNPIVRNILAFIAAIFIGSFVNGAIIAISGSIIPPPIGADVTTEEGLKATMHLFQPQHFIMPLLAHAIGTFVGAFIVAKFAASHNMIFAICIGILFLFGGTYMVMILPSPLWFSITDLTLAYLPMAYIAGKLGIKKGVS